MKWNKDTYDVELNTTETPSVFKAQIFGLTGVSPDRQKVMFKGAVIKDDEWSPTTLKVVKNVSLPNTTIKLTLLTLFLHFRGLPSL